MYARFFKRRVGVGFIHKLVCRDFRLLLTGKHCLSFPSVVLLLQITKEERAQKSKEFNCKLMTENEFYNSYIKKLVKRRDECGCNHEEQEQIILKLPTHYVVLAICVTYKHLQCFILDAANCQDYFAGLINKMKECFDHVWYAVSNEGDMVSQLQKGFFGCSSFAFEVAKKLSKDSKFFSKCLPYADSDGRISWDTLPPQFVQYAQDKDELENYLHQYGLLYTKYAKGLEYFNFNKHKVSGAIWPKMQQYSKKVNEFVVKHSEKECVEIMFPGDDYKYHRMALSKIRDLNVRYKYLPLDEWLRNFFSDEYFLTIKSLLSCNLTKFNEQVKKGVLTGKIDLLKFLLTEETQRYVFPSGDTCEDRRLPSVGMGEI